MHSIFKKAAFASLLASSLAGAQVVPSMATPSAAGVADSKAMDTTVPTKDPKATGPAGYDKGDLEFFEHAAIIGMAEVQAAQLAQTKATTPAAKSYADMMVLDHTKNNEELKALAATKGVTLPTALDKKHQDMLSDLQKEDKKFDKQYAKDMKAGHKKAVELFEKESKKTKDADIRAFAEKTLPTLKHHLEMAGDLKAEVKREK